MICKYYDSKTNTYNLMQQLQDMADARDRNPDRKPPKMYYNYAQQKCYEEASVIPPLKVFLGWTPMKEWIGKCEPFIPSPKIRWIYPVSYITSEVDRYLSEMNLSYVEFRKRCHEILGIPKGKEGDEI